MQRARTLTGLFFQFLQQRWGSLGKRGRLLVAGLAVLLTAGALHLAACAFGVCSAGPCQLEASPCHGASSQSDEPCPFAAPAQATADEAADEPCHMR